MIHQKIVTQTEEVISKVLGIKSNIEPLDTLLIFKKFLLTTVIFSTTVGIHSLMAQSESVQSKIDRIQSIENRERFKPDINYIDQLNRLGEIYYNINPDSTFLLAMKSLKASEEINYAKGIVDAYRNIGAYHNVKGEYAQALGYFREGLSIAEKESYWLGLANIYNSMGLNAYERGEYTTAVSYYIKSLEIKEQHFSKLEQSKTLSNLGLVFMDIGDFNKALEYHNRALEIRQEVNDQSGMAASRINIALVKKENGQLNEAIQEFNSALELGLSMKNKQLVSVSYFNIGETLLLKEDFKAALENFEEALKVDKERGDKVGIGFDLLAMGEAQMNMQMLSKAKKNIKESLKIFVESDIKSNINKSHLLLSRVFEEENNNAQALYHFKLHKLYEDSIINIETEKQIREITAKYKAEKIEAEYLVKQKEQEILNEKEMEKNIRTGITIILIIIFIAFLFAIRSIKTQIKAKSLVTRQKNEFEVLNKQLLQQKEENEKINDQLHLANETKDKLFSIVGHDLKSPINSLKGLMQYVVDEKLNQHEFLLVADQLRNEVEQVHFTLINLLQWAKGQMRGIVTYPKRISVHQILEENINLNNPISKSKNIQIFNNLEENTICFIDKEQINLVFRNILNNAIKFTNKGGEIFVSSKKQGDKFWEISIRDTGIGMSQETIENLYSLNITGKQQYGTEGEKGTGLGLQLTRDFILKNGGDIKVSSEKGQGTTFTIILPAG